MIAICEPRRVSGQGSAYLAQGGSHRCEWGLLTFVCIKEHTRVSLRGPPRLLWGDGSRASFFRTGSQPRCDRSLKLNLSDALSSTRLDGFAVEKSYPFRLLLPACTLSHGFVCECFNRVTSSPRVSRHGVTGDSHQLCLTRVIGQDNHAERYPRHPHWSPSPLLWIIRLYPYASATYHKQQGVVGSRATAKRRRTG